MKQYEEFFRSPSTGMSSSQEKKNHTRLQAILGKEVFYSQVPLKASLMTKIGLGPTMGQKMPLGLPPRPYKFKSKGSIVDTNDSSRLMTKRSNSRESRTLDILNDSNKENCRDVLNTKTSINSISKLSNLTKASSPSAKQFMIRRSSPARSLKSHSGNSGVLHEEDNSVIKNSSLKYRFLVEKSRRGSSRSSMLKIINDLPRITAKSWALLDGVSGDILFGHKPSLKREVASLTKLMTLYTACKIIEESKINYHSYQCVVSSNAATRIGTSAYLKTGDKIMLKDLLYACMLPSGNDAAQAICESLGEVCFKKLRHHDPEQYKRFVVKKVSNFEKHFLDEMNENALIMGLRSTYYANPHGLMNTLNQSSAYDVATVVQQGCNRFKMFKGIISTKEYTTTIVRGEDRVETSWSNTHLLLDNETYIGGKTGVTNSAGPCLATVMSLPGGQDTAVLVLLRCITMENRFSETKEIYDWLCDHYGSLKKLPQSVRSLES